MTRMPFLPTAADPLRVGGYPRRWLWLGVLLVNLVVIAATGFALSYSREQHRERAFVIVENLSQVLEQDISGDVGEMRCICDQGRLRWRAVRRALGCDRIEGHIRTTVFKNKSHTGRRGNRDVLHRHVLTAKAMECVVVAKIPQPA